MKTLVITLKIFFLLTILTGVIYPLLVTGIAKTVFPDKADGSLLIKDNKIVGSKLIGQQFDSAIYFTGRPSATNYNTLPSGGSNLGPSNAKLRELADERRLQFIRLNKLDTLTEVPAEMLFASASGLDPHISLQAAILQVERVAYAREMNSTQKQQLMILVNNICEKPQFGFLGEERINVLLLNEALDKLE
jgi:K+-transporting ATPase ATPase C chain